MTPRTVVFSGGRVVTPDRSAVSDVVATDGVITEITPPGVAPGRGDRIDCDGLLVMPGMVDTHVHLMDPGPTDREDFPTGTRAASARGVTTIVEHTHATPIRSVDDLSEKRSHLAGRSNVDFGLAAHMWPDRIHAVPDLWGAGVTFFKIFTCTTHGVPGLDPAMLSSALHAIGGVDGRALIHCEDESITAEAERILRGADRIDPGLLIEWRNREAEEVAVAVAATLVRRSGATATVAHVSTPAVLDIIDAARSQGADIAAEACPQYLALDEAEVVTEGALRKFTPPARITGPDDRQEMWAAVRSGRFSHFSTDHAPSTLPQKLDPTFWDAPFGLPGLDTTYPFLIDAALRKIIPFELVADMAAAAPARRYGLAPNKGRIAVGGDADLVLVDPDSTWTVARADIISKAGWSPYEGHQLLGKVVSTYLRGQQIALEGRSHDSRTGRFIHGLGTDRPGSN